MSLTPDQIRMAAAQLDRAETTRTQVKQFSQLYPDMTIADAYAVQAAWVALKIENGRTIRGHKIGLTSRAMQSALAIDEPDSGLNATDFVMPALEILDTRIERIDPQTKATRKIVDTIADNAANAGIVLGGRPIRPMDADLRWIGALCYRNGQLEETGLAAGVLNHPANGVAWLVRKIAAQGLALEPGQVVLAGSFIRPIEAKSGDTIQADYGRYGSVSCYFA